MNESGGSGAFVPGHITVFFGPKWHDNPERCGSIGAGIALTDGVTTRVTPASSQEILFNGSETHMEPVELVCDQFQIPVRVTIDTPLPLGAGFGVSGAATLGTTLALNDISEGNWTENELISIAHCAEVVAGTGLGDVVAQARGGLPIRIEAGAPPHGYLDGLPARPRIEYYSIGNLDTHEILRGETEILVQEGTDAINSLRQDPRLSVLFELGRDFAEKTDLVTPKVQAVIDDVVAAGGEATMALLGETIIAIDSGLSDAGYDPRVCCTNNGGFTLIKK